MGKAEYLVFSYREGDEIYTKRGRTKKSIVQHTARGRERASPGALDESEHSKKMFSFHQKWWSLASALFFSFSNSYCSKLIETSHSTHQWWARRLTSATVARDSKPLKEGYYADTPSGGVSKTKEFSSDQILLDPLHVTLHVFPLVFKQMLGFQKQVALWRISTF